MESKQPFSRREVLKTIGTVSLFGAVTHVPLTIAAAVEGGPPPVKRNLAQLKQLLDDRGRIEWEF